MYSPELMAPRFFLEEVVAGGSEAGEDLVLCDAVCKKGGAGRSVECTDRGR